jgi:hypothetical protein
MLHDLTAMFGNWFSDLLSAIAPALFGSAVGQAWSKGLTWRQRLLQWVVGILVSYYVTMGLSELLHFGPFMSQAVGFVLAMIAFEVAPKIIAGSSTAAGNIPTYLAQFVAKWTK